ncbi:MULTISPECIES: hypothetical protein [unclassified Amycolatopsis]|uniref:hypothetical protein n=1 Tax=unclassified Amycolatopsis TaxID=2618356 RepID=UPI002874327F|nr:MULTISPECIES: hypothetical protein [unclassified Amycolatopsis]MDS0133571.1 hypothetical protein [Amycolatopsis sp. 505]MDS0148584.1 hypothetical protein [Amycolatopsis sp. CM201R]
MAQEAAEAKINALSAELKLLRKGLGVQAKTLPALVGEQLREVCGVDEEDTPGTVRGKVVETLRRLIEKLPDSQRRTARIVLGFGTGPNERYTQRLELLGTGADRNVRTMQRRADDVIYLIAEAAYGAPSPYGGSLISDDGPWHTSALAVRLTLTGVAAAEVFETRRVVSHVAGLADVEHAISLARPASTTVQPDLSGLGIDVVAGGEVHSVRMVSSSRVAFSLRPPQPLDAGDEHEFFFRIRVDELPSPFYCCTPEFPCESFDLNVRFDRRQPPQRVWRIDGEFSKDAQDPLTARKPLFLDNAGEVHTSFRELRPARSYGVGWQPAS